MNELNNTAATAIVKSISKTAIVDRIEKLSDGALESAQPSDWKLEVRSFLLWLFRSKQASRGLLLIGLATMFVASGLFLLLIRSDFFDFYKRVLIALSLKDGAISPSMFMLFAVGASVALSVSFVALSGVRIANIFPTITAAALTGLLFYGGYVSHLLSSSRVDPFFARFGGEALEFSRLKEELTHLATRSIATKKVFELCEAARRRDELAIDSGRYWDSVKAVGCENNKATYEGKPRSHDGLLKTIVYPNEATFSWVPSRVSSRRVGREEWGLVSGEVVRLEKGEIAIRDSLGAIRNWKLSLDAEGSSVKVGSHVILEYDPSKETAERVYPSALGLLEFRKGEWCQSKGCE